MYPMEKVEPVEETGRDVRRKKQKEREMQSEQVKRCYCTVRICESCSWA